MSLVSGLLLPLTLAKRELRQGKVNFILSTVTMALAVSMLAAVLGMTDSLRETLRRDAKAILGGDFDVELEARGFTDQERAWFQDNSDRLTETIYLRAAAYTEQQSSLIQLRAVDNNYPLFGELVLAEGAKYDHQLLIDSDLSDDVVPALVTEQLAALLQSGIGDQVSIGSAKVQIVGFISEIPDPNTSIFLSAPVIYIDYASLPVTGLSLPGALKDENIRVDIGNRDPVVWRQNIDTAFEEAPWRVRGNDNVVPGTRRVIGRMEALMLLVSLGAMLVAGICVGNTISTYLQSKLNTIAILKSVGLPANQLRLTFFFVALSFAGLGCVLGLPIAYFLQDLIVTTLSDRLPFNVETAVTWRTYAIVPAIAMLTTLIFISRPMYTFAAISPARLFAASGGSFSVDKHAARQGRKALIVPTLLLITLLGLAANDKLFLLWFSTGGAIVCVAFQFFAKVLIKLINKIKPKQVAAKIAFRSIARSSDSISSASAALGIGLTVLLMLALTQANFDNQLNERLATEVPAFYVAGLQAGDTDKIRTELADMLPENGLRELPVQRAKITHFKGVEISQLDIPEGFRWIVRGDRIVTWAEDPLTQWRGASKVSAGDLWGRQDAFQVSFDEEAAEAFGLEIGDEISLNILGQNYDVTIRNLRNIDWSTFDVNFIMVLSDGPWAQLPHGYLGSVRSVIGSEDVFQRALVKIAPSATPIQTKLILEISNTLLRKIGSLLNMITLTALFSGVLVLAAAIANGRHRRAFDALVLRMLGSSHKLLVRIFRIEFIVIAILAVFPALLAASLASYTVTTWILELEWKIDWSSSVIIILATLFIVQLLGFASTNRLIKHPPLTLLRNE